MLYIIKSLNWGAGEGRGGRGGGGGTRRVNHELELGWVISILHHNTGYCQAQPYPSLTKRKSSSFEGWSKEIVTPTNILCNKCTTQSLPKNKMIEGCDATLGAKGPTHPLKLGSLTFPGHIIFVLFWFQIYLRQQLSPSFLLWLSPLNAGRYPTVLGKGWRMPAHMSSALHLSKGLAIQE